MKPGKIIKWFFIVLLAAFFIFLFARIFMQSRNEVLTDIYPTENAVSAYSLEGDSAFTYHKFSAEINSDGYFSAYHLAYCESTGELQLTSRYNDSVYKYMGVDSGADFGWELRDENGETVAVGEAVQTEKNYVYNYTRIVFENVDIAEDTQLYLYLICDECGYPEEDTAGFPVHTPNQKLKTYKLSRDELSELAN